MSFRHLPAVLAQEVNPALFDEYLEALAAFPENPPRRENGEVDLSALPNEAIRTRRWGETRASPHAIAPDQVVSLQRAMPKFLRVAYEIEEPWVQYTAESVATLENNGIGRLAGFMGAVWRADERRHAALFKTAYLQVTQEQALEAIPHHWDAPVHGEAVLVRHLFMRLVAELSAGATYLVLAAHSRHELSDCMLNVAGDEFRHLAVFWAACKWWLGEGLAKRVARTVMTTSSLAYLHRQQRSDMGSLGLEGGVMVVELGAAMGLTMLHLLRWDSRLSASKLESVFGSVQVCRQRRVAPPMPSSPSLAT